MDKAKALKLLDLTSLPSKEEDLKHSFRQAIKKAHPDHGGSDEKARLVIDAFASLEEILKGGVEIDRRRFLWDDYMRSKVKNVFSMEAWLKMR